jgi:hypothetical protein
MDSNAVEVLADLEQQQRVRLTLGDGGTVEGRAAQCEYTPDDRLRLELTPTAGGEGRYQARASYDGGWSPIELRHAGERRGEGWRTLGEVVDVTPLGTSGYPDYDE